MAGAWGVGSLDLAFQGLFLLSVVAKLCLDSWNPVDGSRPGSSVLGIPQARILEWVTITSSRGSSPPRDLSLSPELQADSLLLSHRESPPRSLGPSFLSCFSLSSLFSSPEWHVPGADT